MSNEPILIFADGLCEPNPGGLACYGWLALSPAGEILAERSAVLGQGAGFTNNVVEYEAVLAALRWAWAAGYRAATVRSDSQLVVYQVQDRWSCGAPALVPLLARVRRAQACMALVFEWVPRAENGPADARSRAAYRAQTGHDPPIHDRRAKAAA